MSKDLQNKKEMKLWLKNICEEILYLILFSSTDDIILWDYYYVNVLRILM